MKKIFLPLFLTVATLKGAHADSGSFNGFYLGGHVGGAQRPVKTDFPSIDWTVNVKDSAVNKTNKPKGLTYGLYGGYGQTRSDFYWGIELNLDHDTSRHKATHPIKAEKRGVETAQYPTKLHTQYQRGVVLGITPRLGAVIANDTLLYVKWGVEMSRDKVEAHHEWVEVNARGCAVPGSGASKKVSASKTQTVFVPGIGCERAFGKVLARLEYNYNLGAKVKTHCLVTNAMTKDTPATSTYSAHVIKAGLSYHF
jgi:opacity protein-like surface antigen